MEIPCLAFLKPVVCKHIPQQYSKEMAEKSEMVLYYTLYSNDKTLSCTVQSRSVIKGIFAFEDKHGLLVKLFSFYS